MPVNSFSLLTDDNIKDVVTKWCKGPTNQEHIDVSNNYGHISTWDVSKVTNMSGLFQNKVNFNDDISGWNVSHVTNMSNMFSGASEFNQPISGWITKNVNNMSNMFYRASKFNQPINTLYNYKKVQNTDYMSIDWSIFAQDALAYKMEISSIQWDVSRVTNMSNMFEGASSFNQPISKWNTSKVTDMSHMFRDTTFDQPLNTSGSEWDVSGVNNMSYMFYNASGFNQFIDKWKVNPDCILDNTFTDVGLSTDNKHKMTLDTSWNQNNDFKRLWLPTFANPSPPSSADIIISNHSEDTVYTFKLADFPFNDSNTNDTLQKIKLISLPPANTGKLEIGGVGASINKDILASDILNNKFTYKSNKDYYGDVSFTFKVSDGQSYSNQANKFTIKVYDELVIKEFKLTLLT